MKKLSVIFVAMMLVLTTLAASLSVSANIVTAPDEDAITVLRGYEGEKGSYSFDSNKINLNGSGVVASAQKITWIPGLITGECGVIFTVTYNEDYTSVGDACEDYRVAFALMDSQNFQGSTEGNGLGVELRLSSAEGNIKAMGLYYQGSEENTDIKYPGRNKSSGIGNASAGKSVTAKLAYAGNVWRAWIDTNNDATVDALVAEFDPTSSWEAQQYDGAGAGQYFPTNLFSGGEAYLVFGAYTGQNMNVSITVNSVYGGLTLEEPVSEEGTELEGAYKAGNDFTMFLDMENTDLVKTGTTWALAANDGAMDGKALQCNAAAVNASGAGVTIRFAVPEEGDYYFWGRVYFPNQTSNSMFYCFDGGTEYIWDLPDEDAASSVCYNSWQYFYMTYRAAGTYTDTTQYGSYTIQYGDWRHAPQKVHLTAGVHELKITGREAGMLIDELIITTNDVTEYDPNACEGNNNYLETCKFCGTEWKHYCKDVYALTGTTAETAFTAANTNAKAWVCPYYDELIPTSTGGDSTGGDSTGGTTGGDSTGGTTGGDSTGGTTGGDSTGGTTGGNSNEQNTTAPDTEATTTTAPATDDAEGGCKSSASILSVLGMAVLGGAMMLKRKK